MTRSPLFAARKRDCKTYGRSIGGRSGRREAVEIRSVALDETLPGPYLAWVLHCNSATHALVDVLATRAAGPTEADLTEIAWDGIRV